MTCQYDKSKEMWYDVWAKIGVVVVPGGVFHIRRVFGIVNIVLAVAIVTVLVYALAIGSRSPFKRGSAPAGGDSLAAGGATTTAASGKAMSDTTTKRGGDTGGNGADSDGADGDDASGNSAGISGAGGNGAVISGAGGNSDSGNSYSGTKTANANNTAADPAVHTITSIITIPRAALQSSGSQGETRPAARYESASASSEAASTTATATFASTATASAASSTATVTMTPTTTAETAANAAVTVESAATAAAMAESAASNTDAAEAATSSAAATASASAASTAQVTSATTLQPTTTTQQPTAVQTAKKDAKAISGKIICIDPGHQVKQNSELEKVAPDSDEKKPKVSSGTAGIATGDMEYVLNLAVGLKLKKLLEDGGATVVMTRTTHDVNISNIERAKIGNDAKSDLVIRIHADGSDNRDVKGISMLIPSSRHVGEALAATSKKAGGIVLNEVIAVTGAKDRGLSVRDDMTGFNWSTVPVILIEMGFMSNADEDRLLATDEYRDKLAIGLYNGCVAFFTE